LLQPTTGSELLPWSEPVLHSDRDREFESAFLQRGVTCELDFLDHGAELGYRVPDYGATRPVTVPRSGLSRGQALRLVASSFRCQTAARENARGTGRKRFFGTKARQMSRAERRAMVERVNPVLPVFQQCRLLAVSRLAVYRKPVEVSAEDLAIMALIDRQYLVRPYYGSRRMAAWLATQGHVVNRKRVQRLMRLLGLVAIDQRPNASRPAAAHKVYPYLLGGIAIEWVNQVWCADVTYIPMAKRFLYLVVIMDWMSRAVLAWRLSNTLGADFGA
jgi:hypothetical protein